MKLEKAIEILTVCKNEKFLHSDKDILDSLKLGLEALKAVLKLRHYPFPDEILELPGETKD